MLNQTQNTLTLKSSHDTISYVKNLIETLVSHNGEVPEFITKRGGGLDEEFETLGELSFKYLGSHHLVSKEEVEAVTIEGDCLTWTVRTRAMPYVAFALAVLEELSEEFPNEMVDFRFSYFNHMRGYFGEVVVCGKVNQIGEPGLPYHIAESFTAKAPKVLLTENFSNEVCGLLEEAGITFLLEDILLVEKYKRITGVETLTVNELQSSIEFLEMEEDEQDKVLTEIRLASTSPVSMEVSA